MMIIVDSHCRETLLVRNCCHPKQGQWSTSDRRQMCSTHGHRPSRYQKRLIMPWVEYIYGSVREFPFWKLLLLSRIASSLRSFYCLQYMSPSEPCFIPGLWLMLTKFMRQEGPQLSLPFGFKTSLFFSDNINERSSYNHLIFPIDTSFSVDYISIGIHFICTLISIYMYITSYNNSPL
jgi:hypothetical protein